MMLQSTSITRNTLAAFIADNGFHRTPARDRVGIEVWLGGGSRPKVELHVINGARAVYYKRDGSRRIPQQSWDIT